MNNEQRQLLADNIDAIEREIEDLELSLDNLRGVVVRKETRLQELKNRRTKLREGIDW